MQGEIRIELILQNSKTDFSKVSTYDSTLSRIRFAMPYLDLKLRKLSKQHALMTITMKFDLHQ